MLVAANRQLLVDGVVSLPLKLRLMSLFWLFRN